MMLLPFFLIIDLYFLIAAVMTQIVNLIKELVNLIGIPTYKAKAEIETDPVIVEIAISEWSIKFKTLKTFFMLLTH